MPFSFTLALMEFEKASLKGDKMQVSDLPARAARAMDEMSALDRPGEGADRLAARTMAALASHGLLSFGFLNPANTGAQAGDMRQACEVIAALAERSSTVATVFMLSGVLCPLCVSYLGTEEQKAALLPRTAGGTLQLAFALTEPGAGSDAAAAATQATPTANGYVLHGEKIYITGSATADYVLTVARSSLENPKAFGVFLVPADARNLTVTPLPKMGGNDHASCHVTFDGVELDASQVLGGSLALGDAWKVLRITGMLERLIVAAMACGMARSATARATGFIKERKQFGQALSNFQSIQHAVVDMSTLTTAMEAMAAHAVQAYENGSDAGAAISKAKLFCAESLMRVVESALRVMGGRAFFDFEPVSHVYREAPLCLFAGGTSEIQKILIARSLGI